MRQPFYAWLENYWMALIYAQWGVFFGAATSPGRWPAWRAAMRCASPPSVFLWGVVVRTVVTWQLSWAINSVTHLWGYRSYQTADDSRNNLFLGYVAGGEGWHNNHHAHPSSAMHGHNWWEFDPVFWVIRGLAAVGLAKDIKLPGPLSG